MLNEKCEFCGKVVFMSTFGLTCLECDELPARQNRIKKLEEALMRIRDCDWVISLPDRMDLVRDIAREALQ